MRTWYSQDDEDTYTLHIAGLVLATPADVDRHGLAHRDAAEAVLAARHGRPWWCLVDLEGVVFGAAAVAALARSTRATIDRYYLGTVRYGQPADGKASIDAIRDSARLGRFPSLCFDTRMEAELAMATLKRHPPRPLDGPVFATL